MRICHFVASVGLGRGEAYIDIANSTAELHPEIEVGLLIPIGAKFRPRISPRINVLEFNDRGGRRNPLMLWDVYRHLRCFKPDLVHTHFARATEIYHTLYPILRIPFVASKRNPRRGRIYERVPHVIGVSHGVAKSIKHGQVEVIYNGLVPESVVKRNDPHDPMKPLRLLTCGRLDPIKGYDRLIRALSHSSVDWELTILGDGDQRAELDSLCKTLGVSNRVHMPGFCNHPAQKMADCDLFVISSISEGFCVALLEGMHYAPLCLSTPVGLAAELFPDWMLWEHDDAASLDTALRNYNANRARYQNWASANLADFQLEKTITKHVAYYRKVLGQ